MTLMETMMSPMPTRGETMPMMRSQSEDASPAKCVGHHGCSSMRQISSNSR